MSRRPRRGIPDNIDYLRASLLTRDKRKWPAKGSALREVATFVGIIFDRTIAGDADCASFLAELLAFLTKNRLRLEGVNQTFRDTWLKWESARPSTIKGSELRQLIHNIIVMAQRRRFEFRVAESMAYSHLVRKFDKRLTDLPDFGPLPDVVEKWVNVVVYPELQKMTRKLEAHPQIGKLKKATDENGKFQLSRLKPLIRQTVARIAALPRPYFFNIK
jgi:hypothetical protein